MLFHLVQTALVDDRTVGDAFVKAVAELEGFDLVCEARGEFGVDGGLDEESICSTLERFSGVRSGSNENEAAALVETQVWPEHRNLHAIAPATAASRLASSKTMKGALPPSSKESFLSVEADWDISSLPTWVCGQTSTLVSSSQKDDWSGRITHRASKRDLPNVVILADGLADVLGPLVGRDDVDDALGDASPFGELRQRKRRIGRLGGCFDNDGTPSGDGGSLATSAIRQVPLRLVVTLPFCERPGRSRLDISISVTSSPANSAPSQQESSVHDRSAACR